MTTKAIPRVLLTLGFVAASLGYSSWTAQRTFLDPAATKRATHALLATPAVQTMLTRELHRAIAPALAQINAAGPTTGAPNRAGPKRRALNARAANDAEAKLNQAIDAAVRDPKFVGAFEDAIMTVHEGVLSGDPGQVTLDSKAVTAVLDQAIARIDPSLAPKTKHLKPVSVPIGGSGLPHIGDIRHNARVIGDSTIAIAFLLIGGALLLVHDRKMFRRTGRRIAFLALPPALVFLLVPRLLASSHNSGFAVSAAILRVYGNRVMFSAAVIAALGVGVWLTALVWPSRREAEPDAPPPSAEHAAPLPDPRMPSSEPVGVPGTVYL
jgi:hypothetical protein